MALFIPWEQNTGTFPDMSIYCTQYIFVFLIRRKHKLCTFNINSRNIIMPNILFKLFNGLAIFLVFHGYPDNLLATLPFSLVSGHISLCANVRLQDMVTTTRAILTFNR